MKFETTSVNIAYSVTLKSVNLACTLNFSFNLLYDFVTSFIGHLGKYCFT